MKSNLFIILLMAVSFSLHSQEKTKPVNHLGLTVEYGWGGVAVKDDYLSGERYTGTTPYLGVWYNRLDERKGFQLGFTHQEDDQLENNAIRASFLQASLVFDQLFNVKSFVLFKQPANWYFGPSVEYFEYELINRFASNHKAFSELIMASMGIASLVEWQFTDRFMASLFLRSNIIGVNHKTHDELKYPDKNSALQTFITANHLVIDLSLRYRVLKRVSLGLRGKGHYIRSTGWDESQAFTNSLVVFGIIHF
jgi:hypothetical protein